jgi:predicted helicase
MSKIDKGTIYEEYVCNYINKNNTNLIAYIWKNVPDFILFNANLIDDINDCRINRDTCKNYIHDIGIDIIQFNKDNNEIYFIQCKNYEGTLCINDLAGYFAIMSQKEHYNKKGIISGGGYNIDDEKKILKNIFYNMCASIYKHEYNYFQCNSLEKFLLFTKL